MARRMKKLDQLIGDEADCICPSFVGGSSICGPMRGSWLSKQMRTGVRRSWRQARRDKRDEQNRSGHHHTPAWKRR